MYPFIHLRKKKIVLDYVLGTLRVGWDLKVLWSILRLPAQRLPIRGRYPLFMLPSTSPVDLEPPLAHIRDKELTAPQGSPFPLRTFSVRILPPTGTARQTQGVFLANL